MHLCVYTEICIVSAKETNNEITILTSQFQGYGEFPCGFAVTKSGAKDYKITFAFQEMSIRLRKSSGFWGIKRLRKWAAERGVEPGSSTIVHLF